MLLKISLHKYKHPEKIQTLKEITYIWCQTFMQVLPNNTAKVSEGKNTRNFNREYLIYIIGYNLHI